MNPHSIIDENDRITRLSPLLRPRALHRASPSRSHQFDEFLVPDSHRLDGLYNYAMLEQNRVEVSERLLYATLAGCGLAAVLCAFG